MAYQTISTYSTPVVDHKSGMAEWPEDWPWYKQSCFLSFDKKCDMVIGFCSCGAAHFEGEFQIIDGKLYRYGKPVHERDTYWHD